VISSKKAIFHLVFCVFFKRAFCPAIFLVHAIGLYCNSDSPFCFLVMLISAMSSFSIKRGYEVVQFPLE